MKMPRENFMLHWVEHEKVLYPRGMVWAHTTFLLLVDPSRHLCFRSSFVYSIFFSSFSFRCFMWSFHMTKTCLFKYIENLTTKNWKFSDENSYIFHISAQYIDCVYSLEPPRQGGSNEYPQSMLFLRRNKNNNVYPCKSQFYYIKKWGLRGSKSYRHVFVML